MSSKILRSCVIAVLTVSLLTVSFAQSPPPQKKKIEDFGSSLKRLKWNPEKNAAVDVASTTEELEAGDVIRIETSLVACDLLVLDNQGKNVLGLTATDFSITEDNQPQAVGHFLLGDNVNVPRTIVLIIDYSGSQLPYLKNSITAAKVLVDKLGPKDRMAIVTDDVELLVDFTDDKKKLRKELESLQQRTKWKKGFFRTNEKFRIGRSKQ